MTTTNELIVKYYPRAIDCLDGHIGKTIKVIEQELDDDRYRDVSVERCDHCNMPCGKVEYV